MATKADIDAWIAKQGGPDAVSYGYEDIEAANPAFGNPDHPNYQGRTQTPDKVTSRREMWTNRTTGATYSAVRTPGGTDEFQDVKETPGTKATASSGTTTQVEGTPDPSKEGGFDNSRPRMVTRSANGAITEARPLTKAEREEWQGVATGQEGTAVGSAQKTDAQGKTVKVTTYKRPDGSTYERTDSVEVPPPPGQIVPGTTAASAQYTGFLNPTTGEIAWTDNPNAIPPKDQRWVFKRGTDGTVTREKNPYYEKPSKLVQDPSDPRKWIELTEDDHGDPVVKPVTNTTTIKPADLPVLQSKYGEIAQDLGRLAQELNQRVARQEMTPQERTEAFTAAYKQAETQVSEINSILDNSKAIWSGQVQQRGQSLSETQSRRSFASDAAGRAIAAGNQVAQGALPGHGKEIVAGVEALMNMQQRYAQGMGGFRESPEIGLPPALEQARGIGLPGYPMPSGASPGGAGGAPGPAVAPPPPPPAAGPPNAIGAGAIGSLPAPGGAPAPPSGISNTTDAGGVPREYTPASVTGGGSGQPPVAAMGAALGSGQGFAGGPVAGGGAGMWDPMQAVQGMLGQGGDAAWEEAVRRAAGSFGRYG